MNEGTTALLQEMRHVCHPLTRFVPAKGHPMIPRNKRREKGWMPWLGLSWGRSRSHTRLHISQLTLN